MCNINAIFLRDENEKKKIKEAMNSISYLSFYKNSDGEGYLAKTKEGLLWRKSNEKIIYRIKNLEWIISHQRLATSGEGISNIHPHILKIRGKRYYFFHNGVFNGLGTTLTSDSKEFFLQFKKNLEEMSKTKITANKELTALKKTIEQHSGTFSCFLYSTRTEKLYYWKEAGTKMNVASGKDFLFMATLKDNVEYLMKFFKKESKAIEEVKPGVIYSIDFETFELIKEETFTEKIFVYPQTTKYWNTGKGKGKKKQQNLSKREVEEFLYSRYSAYIGVDYEKIKIYPQDVAVVTPSEELSVMLEQDFATETVGTKLLIDIDDLKNLMSIEKNGLEQGLQQYYIN